jgi:hypothetical protein
MKPFESILPARPKKSSKLPDSRKIFLLSLSDKYPPTNTASIIPTAGDDKRMPACPMVMPMSFLIAGISGPTMHVTIPRDVNPTYCARTNRLFIQKSP